MKKRFFRLIAGLITAAPLLVACTHNAVQATTQTAKHVAPPALTDTAAESASGIRVTALRLTSAGYMLDMRYQVVDAEKAAPLLRKSLDAYLLQPTTGARLMIPDTPKLGALRQRVDHPNPDKTYFMFFANPNRYLKSGDQVTLVIGDAQLANLSIE